MFGGSEYQYLAKTVHSVQSRLNLDPAFSELALPVEYEKGNPLLPIAYLFPYKGTPIGGGGRGGG